MVAFCWRVKLWQGVRATITAICENSEFIMPAESRWTVAITFWSNAFYDVQICGSSSGLGLLFGDGQRLRIFADGSDC